DLLKEWTGDVIRLGILSHHYRTPWEWDEELLPSAQTRLNTWRAAAGGPAAPADEVRAALDEDLDTPAALQVLDRAAADGRDVTEAAALLGVTVWPGRGP